MSKILVAGATGNVGRHVVYGLVKAGREVRALTRDPERASLPAGVEVAYGDLSARDTVAAALPDVEQVFLIWPGLAVQPDVIQEIADRAGRVVYLSTDVSDLADHEPPTSFHQEIERLIRQSGLRWTFVRAIDFATNTLGWAGQIRQGVVRLPHGQASRSLIHERDIADVIVHALTRDGHDGAKYLITGPESITQAELVAIIGEAIGRKLRWDELPVDAARPLLIDAWGNPDFVEARLKAWASFVETPERVTDTVERLLGRPALTFRAWAHEHADDFR